MCAHPREYTAKRFRWNERGAESESEIEKLKQYVEVRFIHTIIVCAGDELFAFVEHLK